MIPKKGKTRSRPLSRDREYALSDREPTQRRALYCASLISLGALCAGMVFFRAEPVSRSLIAYRAAQWFGGFSRLQRFLLLYGFPFGVLLLGLAPLGPAILAALDLFFGAAVSLVFSVHLLCSAGFPLALMLCFPAALSIAYLSAAVLHLSGSLFRQAISGGRFRPDLRPVFFRAAVFFLLYEITVYFLCLLL